MPVFQRQGANGVPGAAGCLGVMLTAALAACGGGGTDLSTAKCFDAGLRTAGATTHVVYAVSGGLQGTGTVDTSIVSTSASFAGVTGLIERHVDEKESTSGVSLTSSISYFEKPLGQDSYALLGWVARSTFPIVNTVRTVTYTPPYVDARSALRVGETGVYGATGSDARVTTYPYAEDISAAISNTTTVKLVGVEPVTVPAGVFTACRYEGSSGTEWWYRGIAVKKLQGNVTREMSSGSANGVPL